MNSALLIMASAVGAGGDVIPAGWGENAPAVVASSGGCLGAVAAPAPCGCNTCASASSRPRLLDKLKARMSGSSCASSGCNTCESASYYQPNLLDRLRARHSKKSSDCGCATTPACDPCATATVTGTPGTITPVTPVTPVTPKTTTPPDDLPPKKDVKEPKDVKLPKDVKPLPKANEVNPKQTEASIIIPQVSAAPEPITLPPLPACPQPVRVPEVRKVRIDATDCSKIGQLWLEMPGDVQMDGHPAFYFANIQEFHLPTCQASIRITQGHISG